MKLKLLLTTFVTVIFLLQSCKKDHLEGLKETVVPGKAMKISDNADISDAKGFLQENYSAGSLIELAFESSTVYNLPNEKIVRIPFRNDGINNFILISTDKSQKLKKGVILNLNATSNISKGEAFSGVITIRELNGILKEFREIKKGYKVKGVRSSISGNNIRSSVEPEYQELPEVVVVGYYPSDGGISYSSWLNLVSLFDGGYNTWYGENTYPTGGGGGSYGDNTLQLELDDSESQPRIDLEEYLNCFANMTSYGATYSIQLLVDIPVDGSPGKFFSDESGKGSVGHVSIRLMKFYDDQVVSQTFGFYPDHGPKSLLQTRPSKIVDNGAPGFEAEFNASITMSNITADQFAEVISTMRTNSYKNYDLQDYNCTHFALDAFNAIRGSNRLTSSPFYGYYESPQGLYSKLKSMQSSGHSNIETGVEKKISPSTGTCR